MDSIITPIYLLASIYAAPHFVFVLLVVALVLAIMQRERFGLYPVSGLGLLIAILLILALAGCNTISPEQINAYNAAGQGVIHGVMGDYKAVRPLTRHR